MPPESRGLRPTRMHPTTIHHSPFTVYFFSLLRRVQVHDGQALRVLQDERVLLLRLVYLDRAGLLEDYAQRVVILRARQLYLRGEASRAVVAERGLRAVDHVGHEPPALAVGLDAREPELRDAVEPEAAHDARGVRRLRLELRQDVVAAYDARVLLRGGARVCLLLEGLRGRVD